MTRRFRFVSLALLGSSLAACSAVLGLGDLSDRDGASLPDGAGGGDVAANDGAMGADGFDPANPDGAAHADATVHDGSVDADADAAVQATGTSCKAGGPGMTNCGAGANESCCTSPLIPAGTFSRVYTSSGGVASGLAFSATLSSFRLDTYEVTVGRFRQFVTAWNANWRPADGSGKHVHVGALGLADVGTAGAHESGWVTAIGDGQVAVTTANLASDGAFSTWTSTAAGGNENKPINTVNWYEAFAFCIYDGGFLPSEAEWEYAAAGGSDQRAYPWGTAVPTTALANYGCFGRNDCDGGTNAPAPVGSVAASTARWGQLDLAGNVWEWTMDWYVGDGNHYQTSACTDCVSATPPDPNIGRSSRGGDFYNDGTNLPPPLRNQFYGSQRTDQRTALVGFRCARSP